MKYGETEIITEGYPKEMMVWDDDERRCKTRLVLCETPGVYYPYRTFDASGGSSAYRNAKDLHTTKPRTIEDGLKEDDIIVDSCNNKVKILGICGEVIFKSSTNRYDVVSGPGYTLQELINGNWKLPEQTQDIIELTIQDISEGKGKGVDPSLIRIKE